MSSVKVLWSEPEVVLQRKIVQLAELHGWMVYHTFDSRRSPAGFPDLVMVRRGDLVCAEIKSEVGQLSPKQQKWLLALDLCPGVKAFIWRPSQWAEIEEVLA